MPSLARSMSKPLKVPSLARSVPKPLKVTSLARSVPKPLKVPSLARSVPKPFKWGMWRRVPSGTLLCATSLSYWGMWRRASLCHEPLLLFAADLLLP